MFGVVVGVLFCVDNMIVVVALVLVYGFSLGIIAVFFLINHISLRSSGESRFRAGEKSGQKKQNQNRNKGYNH